MMTTIPKKSNQIYVFVSKLLYRNLSKSGDHYCYNRKNRRNMEQEYVQVRRTKKMGRGIFAKKDIPARTNILTIQQSSFLTYELVKQHPIFSRIEDDIESKLCCFAYYLSYCQNLTEPNEDELPIKTYLQELPTHFHNLICWDQEELDLLYSRELSSRIQKKKEEFKMTFDRIKESFNGLVHKLENPIIEEVEMQSTVAQSKRSTRFRPIKQIRYDNIISKSQKRALEQVAFSQVLKYMASVKSRNIYWEHQSDYQSQVGALIPFLELFNHSQNSQCCVNQRNGSEQVVTIRPIKKGEEIFLKYGDNISIQEFLQNYGMIPFQQTDFSLTKRQEKQNQQSSDCDCQNKCTIFSVKQQRMELIRRYVMHRNKNSFKKTDSKLPLTEKN